MQQFSILVNVGAQISKVSLSKPMLFPVYDFFWFTFNISIKFLPLCAIGIKRVSKSYSVYRNYAWIIFESVSNILQKFFLLQPPLADQFRTASIKFLLRILATSVSCNIILSPSSEEVFQENAFLFDKKGFMVFESFLLSVVSDKFKSSKQFFLSVF